MLVPALPCRLNSGYIYQEFALCRARVRVPTIHSPDQVLNGYTLSGAVDFADCAVKSDSNSPTQYKHRTGVSMYTHVSASMCACALEGAVLAIFVFTN